MKDTPQALYKYIPAARLDVLKNLKIRFTQPSALNDPFEFNLIFTEAVSVDEIREHFAKMDKRELFKEAMSSLTEQQRMLLATFPEEIVAQFIENFTATLVSSNHLNDVHQQFIEPRTDELKTLMSNSLNSSIGILSLTANPISPPMWASYAGNSTGFALEFDASHSFFNNRRSEKDEFYHLREVKYEDRAPGGTMLQMAPDVFIHKNKSWEYENEWRMLVPLEKADAKFTTADGDEVSLFSFPAGAISGIVLGLNATEGTIKSILEVVHSSNIYSHIKLSKIKKGATQLQVVPLQNE